MRLSHAHGLPAVWSGPTQCRPEIVARRAACQYGTELASSSSQAWVGGVDGYAGEYVLQGLLWPEGIIDDTIDEEPRDWIELVLVKAARTVRQLCPVVL